MGELLALLGLLIAVVAAIIGWLQYREAKRVADVPKPTTASVPRLADIEERFRQYLINSYRYVDFKGIIQVERLAIRLPLESIYVELRVRPVLQRMSAPEEVRVAGRPFALTELADALTQKAARSHQLPDPISIEEALMSKSGVVILGDPGAGKSTILKFLALTIAEGKGLDRFGLSQGSLPILVPVAAYAAALKAGSQQAVEDFLADYYQRVRGVSLDLQYLFKEAIGQGRAVILLDGLDEITDLDQRMFVVRRVEDFFNWHRDTGNRFVITSRLVGYKETPLSVEGLEHFVLLDLSRREIETFAANWTLALERQCTARTISPSVQRTRSESAY